VECSIDNPATLNLFLSFFYPPYGKHNQWKSHWVDLHRRGYGTTDKYAQLTINGSVFAAPRFFSVLFSVGCFVDTGVALATPCLPVKNHFIISANWFVVQKMLTCATSFQREMPP
jgi:hypothetical protein